MFGPHASNNGQLPYETAKVAKTGNSCKAAKPCKTTIQVKCCGIPCFEVPRYEFLGTSGPPSTIIQYQHAIHPLLLSCPPSPDHQSKSKRPKGTFACPVISPISLGRKYSSSSPKPGSGWEGKKQRHATGLIKPSIWRCKTILVGESVIISTYINSQSAPAVSKPKTGVAPKCRFTCSKGHRTRGRVAAGALLRDNQPNKQ